MVPRTAIAFSAVEAIMNLSVCSACFFFNDTATTEIYTLSLHDALPISQEIQQARPLALPGQLDDMPRGRVSVDLDPQLLCPLHERRDLRIHGHGVLSRSPAEIGRAHV